MPKVLGCITHLPRQLDRFYQLNQTSFQLSMATPNLYREECLHTWFPHMEGLITPMLDIRAGSIYPNGQPGLGLELDMDGINEYRVDIDDLQARLPYQ